MQAMIEPAPPRGIGITQRDSSSVRALRRPRSRAHAPARTRRTAVVGQCRRLPPAILVNEGSQRPSQSGWAPGLLMGEVTRHGSVRRRVGESPESVERRPSSSTTFNRPRVSTTRGARGGGRRESTSSPQPGALGRILSTGSRATDTWGNARASTSRISNAAAAST